MMRLRVAACSEVGARSGNEDALLQGSNALGHHAVLADGAGGHARGEVASALAVQHVQRALSHPVAVFTPEVLTNAVLGAHATLQQGHSAAKGAEARMHTTLVVLWVDAAVQRALWTHVGDSRLYRLRHGRVEQLTVDDSVVQQMVLAGLLTEAQARQHPGKNHLVAALGMEGDVHPHTVARPVDLLEGDAYLLCTDGWWDHFEPDQLAQGLARAGGPEDWLQDMRAQVLANAQAQQDNFSAIAVWVGDPGQMTIAITEETVPGRLQNR